MSSQREAPFCADACARRAFERWCLYLEGECELVLSLPDLVLVGALARAEARPESLSAAVAKAKDPARLIGLQMQAQRGSLCVVSASAHGWSVERMRAELYASRMSSQPLRYSGRLTNGAASGALRARRVSWSHSIFLPVR